MQQKHNVLHSTVGIADNHGQGMSIAVSNQVIPAYPMPTSSSSSSSSHVVGHKAPRQPSASQPVIPSGQPPKLQTQVDQFFPSQTQVQVSAPPPRTALSEVIPLRQCIPTTATSQAKGHYSDNQSSSFGRFVYEVSSESQSNTSESSSSSSEPVTNNGVTTSAVAIVGANYTNNATVTPDAVAEPIGPSTLSPECKAKIEAKRQRALALQQANQLKAPAQGVLPLPASHSTSSPSYPVSSPPRPSAPAALLTHPTGPPATASATTAAAPLSPGTKAKIEASKQRALERLRITALQRAVIPPTSSIPSTSVAHYNLPQAPTLPLAPLHSSHAAHIHQPFMNTTTSPARHPLNYAPHPLNSATAPPATNSVYGYNPSPNKPPQQQPQQQQHVYRFNTAAGTRIEVTDNGEHV